MRGETRYIGLDRWDSKWGQPLSSLGKPEHIIYRFHLGLDLLLICSHFIGCEGHTSYQGMLTAMLPVPPAKMLFSLFWSVPKTALALFSFFGIKPTFMLLPIKLGSLEATFIN